MPLPACWHFAARCRAGALRWTRSQSAASLARGSVAYKKSRALVYGTMHSNYYIHVSRHMYIAIVDVVTLVHHHHRMLQYHLATVAITIVITIAITIAITIDITIAIVTAFGTRASLAANTSERERRSLHAAMRSPLAIMNLWHVC